jgi:hypothetical protein
MSEVRVNNLSNENNTSGPTISGITTFSSPYFFVPPQGDTASRPEDCEPGSLRFNTDSAHLEYFRGNTIGWTEIEAELTAPLGGGTGSNTGVGVRGFAYGGHEGPNGSDTYTAEIDFLTISTLGDATKFGDLTTARGNGIAGFASRTRGIGAGGYATSAQNIIEFITMSSTGDATDFGDLTSNREGPMGLSSETRGIAAAGWSRPNSANIREIDYLTIAETGNSIDFGDLITPTNYGAGTSSTTRGLLIGGYSSPSPQVYTNRIEFITIATTGNAQDFGDYNATYTNQVSAASNATRGLIWGGGGDQAYRTNVIDFVTIATKGNATDFGDMTLAAQSGTAKSSPTRCVYYSGNRGETNVIQFVEIATTGNAADFGDAATGSHGKYSHCGFSNGHGGL